jgi:hypothetical protein
MTLEPRGAPFRFSQLPEAVQERYGWKPPMSLDLAVRLSCESCHRLDSEEFHAVSGLAASSPIRSPGAYMLPVAYNLHCSACHPLHFDPNLPGQQVQHGLPPKKVRADLETFYAAQAVEANPQLLARRVPPRRLPDQNDERLVQTAKAAIEFKVQTALRGLFQSGKRGCTECHESAAYRQPLVESKQIDALTIPTADIPRIWFEHARFDHSAHRAIECVACHGDAKSSRESSKILLPKLETCVRCHGASRRHGSVISGSAGDACTECHDYHNGDQPLQGKGASPRAVALPKDIAAFLREAVPDARHPSLLPRASGATPP